MANTSETLDMCIGTEDPYMGSDTPLSSEVIWLLLSLNDVPDHLLQVA
jgi:hypothetical protein